MDKVVGFMLILFLSFTTVFVFACCKVSGRISRIEEQEELRRKNETNRR